jgi:hypothetical protein
VLPDAIFGYLFDSSLEVEFREGGGFQYAFLKANINIGPEGKK